MNEQELKETWDGFIASKGTGEPDLKLKRKLAEHYYGLVKLVANRMHQKLVQVQPDELASMGVDGLYDAIGGYDRSFNTKFETFAQPRIRGSMLDAIRKIDWVPRQVRAKCNQMEKQRVLLESEAGHRLTSAEMADRLSVNREEFDELLRSTVATAIHSVNDLNDDDSKTMGINHIEDDGICQPVNNMIRKELFAKLMGKNFTPQERMIIWYYYFEDLSMKEIAAEKVKLSESRVSQMHGKILARLKQKIERNPGYFADIGPFLDKFRGFATT